MCDDGEPCSRDDACNGAGTCGGSVGLGTVCILPVLPKASIVKLRRSGDGRKNQLVWRWAKGPDLPESFFGDPTTASSYSVCVFADKGGGPETVAGVLAPSGPPWEPWNSWPGGFRYRDSAAAAGGLRSMDLRPGFAKKVRVKLKAKGPRLGLAALGFGAPATIAVQLTGASGGCLAAVFSDPFLRDDAARFRDRSD